MELYKTGRIVEIKRSDVLDRGKVVGSMYARPLIKSQDNYYLYRSGTERDTLVFEEFREEWEETTV